MPLVRPLHVINKRRGGLNLPPLSASPVGPVPTALPQPPALPKAPPPTSEPLAARRAALLSPPRKSDGPDPLCRCGDPVAANGSVLKSLQERVCGPCGRYEVQHGALRPMHMWRGAVTACANCGQTIERDGNDRNHWRGGASRFIPGAPQVCFPCRSYEKKHDELRPLRLVNLGRKRKGLPPLAASPVGPQPTVFPSSTPPPAAAAPPPPSSLPSPGASTAARVRNNDAPSRDVG